MKYDITYSCGHTCRTNILGKTAERERKIKYYEEYSLCPECYRKMKNEEKSIGCIEVEMKYADYKKEYADCKTKTGTYNKSEKTIVVFVPEEQVAEKEAQDESEEETEKTEEREDTDMEEIKITFKSGPDIIYAGKGKGEWIFDRVWACSKMDSKVKLVHFGEDFPSQRKEEYYSGIITKKTDVNEYYFDYVTEDELIDILIKYNDEITVEPVDLCKVLKVDKDYMVMDIPGGDPDEQPLSFWLVECPEKPRNVRFLECKSCSENATCTAYLNVMQG